MGWAGLTSPNSTRERLPIQRKSAKFLPGKERELVTGSLDFAIPKQSSHRAGSAKYLFVKLDTVKAVK